MMSAARLARADLFVDDAQHRAGGQLTVGAQFLCRSGRRGTGYDIGAR